MNRFTKIICTLGPASAQHDMLAKMADRGMDMVRLNFSHGSHRQHEKMIEEVRNVNKKKSCSIKILQDLEGYRIRIGHFKRIKRLEKNQIVYMSAQKDVDSEDHITFDFIGDIKIIEKGASLFIDDGKIHLRVIRHVSKRLKLKVIQGGILKERKGVNIPKVKLRADIMTPKDKIDLAFGLDHHMDYIAQSFVRNKKDIECVMNMVKPRLAQCKVIAKIENEDGVRNVDSIIDACDGVMVARGDLGVSLPIYKIPIIQKYIVRRCLRKKKHVVIATQMLESMIEQGRPTRAEVSDVANAILDGTDFVMLSGETAVGRYPSRCVQMMRQIIEYTESHE